VFLDNEQHFWNVSVLQRVHVTNSVSSVQKLLPASVTIRFQILVILKIQVGLQNSFPSSHYIKFQIKSIHQIRDYTATEFLYCYRITAKSFKRKRKQTECILSWTYSRLLVFETQHFSSLASGMFQAMWRGSSTSLLLDTLYFLFHCNIN
jgi:hypothetical protein